MKKYRSNDCESWEVNYDLIERKDYPALIKYCQKEVTQNSEDLHAVTRLGEAYILNKQYSIAIDMIGSYHRKYPDIEDFSYIILDALFALGKTENDFEWKQVPCVLRIGRPVLNECYKHLKNKRKPESLDEVCIPLIFKGYLKFKTEDLCQALKADSRFVVEKDINSSIDFVRLRKKGEAEQ